MSVMTTGNVLGVEDRLDRLGDHDAVAGENQDAVDFLSAEVLQVGDLFGLVVVAAVRDDHVDVDAFGFPFVDGFLGAVDHRHQERIGSPKDGVADLVVLGRRRSRGGESSGQRRSDKPFHRTHEDCPPLSKPCLDATLAASALRPPAIIQSPATASCQTAESMDRRPRMRRRRRQSLSCNRGARIAETAAAMIRIARPDEFVNSIPVHSLANAEKRVEEAFMSMGRRFACITLAFGFGVLASAAQAEDQITIGFVTHSQGDPFIQQIIDGAQAAANDLGVTLKVAQQQGGAPDGQLKLVQNIVNAGAQGVATSVPGDSMANSLNDIIASGVPVVQFNLLSAAVKAPYVGEKSTQSGRILGKAIVDKARRRRGQGKGHNRQLLSRSDRAREPRQGRRRVAEGRARHRHSRSVRCEGQRRRELQSLGTALRRESRRGRPGRPVRSRRRQPRQAECRQRRQVRRRRLRPDGARTCRR